MAYLHVGIEFTGTDTHECNTVSVSLVHIGLDLEYKGTELMLRGIDQTNVCLSGQRSGGHLQEMFQKDLHTEIRQCGTKTYRSQITFLYLIQVKLRTGTVQQFHLAKQLVRRIFSDEFFQMFLILYGDLRGSSLFRTLLRIGVSDHTLFLTVVYALESLAGTDGPVDRTGSDSQFLLNIV